MHNILEMAYWLLCFELGHISALCRILERQAKIDNAQVSCLEIPGKSLWTLDTEGQDTTPGHVTRPPKKFDFVPYAEFSTESFQTFTNS